MGKKLTIIKKKRNTKLDTSLAIVAATATLLALILFLVLPVAATKVGSQKIASYTGYQVLFGYLDYTKSSIILNIIFFLVFICFIVFVVGIFNRKFSLVGAFVLILLLLASIFTKQMVQLGSYYEFFTDLYVAAEPFLYIYLGILAIAALLAIYITKDLDFDK